MPSLQNVIKGVFYTRSVARLSGTHSKSMILQMGEVFYTLCVARFSGTHSKSLILQMGEVLIYESNSEVKFTSLLLCKVLVVYTCLAHLSSV